MDVLIYGAGDYGRHAFEKISKFYGEEIRVRAFLDANATGTIQGIPVLSPAPSPRTGEHIGDIPIVIGIGSSKTVCEVAYALKQKGFPKIYRYLKKENAPYCKTSFFHAECMDLSACMEEGDWIPHIETHAVDYCNLNCKACTHFAPLFSAEEFRPETIYEDMERLAAFTDRILSFYIMGGEPFLREDLDQVAKKARRHFPQSNIQVVTNGLLLPEKVPDRILSALEENKIMVSISEYKPTAQVIEQIRERLESHRMDYSIRSAEDKEVFTKTLSLRKDTAYPHLCISDGCVNLYKGKLSRCPSVMYMDRLNGKFHLDLPTDGIYPLSSFSSIQECNEAMRKAIPLCAHCVDYPIRWEPCRKPIHSEDFVIE